MMPSVVRTPCCVDICRATVIPLTYKAHVSLLNSSYTHALFSLREPLGITCKLQSDLLWLQQHQTTTLLHMHPQTRTILNTEQRDLPQLTTGHLIQGSFCCGTLGVSHRFPYIVFSTCIRACSSYYTVSEPSLRRSTDGPTMIWVAPQLAGGCAHLQSRPSHAVNKNLAHGGGGNKHFTV